MKTKKVTRHYCDHCSKGFFQRPATERHEAICFRNPNRKCLRCEGEDGMEVSPPICDRPNPIRANAGECPDCLLSAVIRHNATLSKEARCEGEGASYTSEQYNADRRNDNEQAIQLGMNRGYWVEATP